MDWFLAECRALIILYRSGHLSRADLETRFVLAEADRSIREGSH